MKAPQIVTPTDPQLPLKTNFNNAALVRTYRPCPRISADSAGRPVALILKEGRQSEWLPKRQYLANRPQIRRAGRSYRVVIQYDVNECEHCVFWQTALTLYQYQKIQ
jgi:hypothetical protein